MNTKIIALVALIVIVVGGIVLWRAGQLPAEDVGMPVPGEETEDTEVVEDVDLSDTRSVSRAELATKSTAQECWIAYEGEVYDITPWLSGHPGGAQALLRHCGTAEQFEGALNTQHGPERANRLPDVGVYVGPLEG